MHRSVVIGAAARLLLAVSLVVGSLAVPAVTRASTTLTYSIHGYEIWPTAYVAAFVGGAQGSAGDWAGWRASIEHSGVISPTGWISGGFAELYSSGLTLLRGTFAGGTVTLVGGSETECGTMTHAVEGSLVDVVRGGTTAVGTGTLSATLTHYRTWIFGRCITYSASVSGAMALTF